MTLLYVLRHDDIVGHSVMRNIVHSVMRNVIHNVTRVGGYVGGTPAQAHIVLPGLGK